MNKSATETVFFNSKFVPFSKAQVSFFEPGFLYGWGVFETMRSYQKRIVYLSEHIQRVIRASGDIGLCFPLSPGQTRAIIREGLKINKLNDACVKIMVWKQDEKQTAILISARAYQPYPKARYRNGFTACLYPFAHDNNTRLSGIKSMNYLFYRLAAAYAADSGRDEALVSDSSGHIVQASRSNIFFVKGECVFTPELECGALAGITRKAVLDLCRSHKIEVCTGKFTLEDLYSCREAFVTNSLIGIMPLALVGDKKMGRGTLILTRFLMKGYKGLLDGTKKNISTD